MIDWAQAAPGLFLFCAVLAFSRRRFVVFATDRRATTTLALIAEAFGAIGDGPARCWLIGWPASQVVWSPTW